MTKILLGLLLLIPLSQTGCTGSGAVNPLNPNASSRPDSVNTETSDVIYWSNFPLASPLTDSLNGVCLVSKKLGWICGNNGILLKYDGETWVKVESGLAKNENLLALTFADESNGWAVGSHGTLLSYKNGSWNQERSDSQETLYDVAVTGSRTVWVVGSNGTVLTYNGVSWGKVPVLDEIPGAAPGAAPVTVLDDLYSLSLSDQNNGWAVGGRGRILRFDGQKWSPSTSPSTERLNSVSSVNDIQSWAVGAYGTILRFNGTTWNKMGSPFSGVDLFQVNFRREDDGWVTGQDGSILYYDGNKFITHQRPLTKPSLNGVSFYKDTGFIVGAGGTILKFQVNGEPAGLSFQFKGEVAKAPTTGAPSWTLVYSMLNRGPKTSPFLSFEWPVPKGFEPFLEKVEATPGIGPTPIPTALPSSGPGGAPAFGQVTPGAGAASLSPAATWKLKDGRLLWDLGSIAPSETKSVTFLVREKKGEKKELPVILKASLRSGDKSVVEAAPLTLIGGQAVAGATPNATPETTPNATPVTRGFAAPPPTPPTK